MSIAKQLKECQDELEFLKTHIKNISTEYCIDYPNIEDELPTTERLWAIESMMMWTNLAVNDLHSFIKKLALVCNKTPEEMMAIWDMK